MAMSDQRILKQDGYLHVGGFGTEIQKIVYHPHLNVILVFNTSNQVKILDVHSGVILQLYTFANGKYKIMTKYVLIGDPPNFRFAPTKF